MPLRFSLGKPYDPPLDSRCAACAAAGAGGTSLGAMALFEASAELIGVELGFEVGRSGPDPALDLFAAGTADVERVCSTSFIELTTDRARLVQQVGVTWVPDANGQPVYFSDFLERPGRDAGPLDDLVGLHTSASSCSKRTIIPRS